MNYEPTDLIASVLVTVIVVLGAIAAFQTSEQLLAILYFFGSLLAACFVGGLYLYVNIRRANKQANDQSTTTDVTPADWNDDAEPIGRPGPTEHDGFSGGAVTADGQHEPVKGTKAEASRDGHESDDGGLDSTTRRELLAEFPHDEQRILAPIIASPGLTQVDVREQSNYSKSKVSQTVTDLEERGLISRERDGRTYRIYPDGELATDGSEE